MSCYTITYTEDSGDELHFTVDNEDDVVEIRLSAEAGNCVHLPRDVLNQIVDQLSSIDLSSAASDEDEELLDEEEL